MHITHNKMNSSLVKIFNLLFRSIQYKVMNNEHITKFKYILSLNGIVS